MRFHGTSVLLHAKIRLGYFAIGMSCISPRMLRKNVLVCSAINTKRLINRISSGLLVVAIWWANPVIAQSVPAPPQNPKIEIRQPTKPSTQTKLPAATVSPKGNDPEWLGNKLGRESVILPGFEPIIVKDKTVSLYGRDYTWGTSYLPIEATSRGQVLVKSMGLVAHVGESIIELRPEQVSVTEAEKDYVVIAAVGSPLPGLEVRTETRIEYDGVAMVKMLINPSIPVKVRSLDYIVEIEASPSMEVIAFKAADIRRQKDRTDMLALPYSGDFLNVLGFADGNRSFWWFADNAKGWIWNGDSVTEVYQRGTTIALVQHLIGADSLLTSPIEMQFNFLLTPTSDIGNTWRAKRVLSGTPNNEQVAQGGKFSLWWTSAFAHDAFPYTRVPDSVAKNLTSHDRDAYPGVAANKALVQHARQRFGSYWIPYFSAHVLSKLDPVLLEFKTAWEIVPLREFKEVVLPYTTVAGKPVLSHRANGYSDYVLWRLNEAIDVVDFDGIYLDHGPPHDSVNPSNGGWIDSNGKVQPSLDILGLREFLKRLRTLFMVKGKPGYIFIHNSNREIIPAYTFAYAQFSGEQYRSGKVIDGEFLKTVSVDELRMRLSGHQYGTRMVWLPVEWSYHHDNEEWQDSERQRIAYRRYASLALLLDVITHPIGAHQATRRELIGVLDSFGVDQAQFIGYWDPRTGATSSDSGLKISAYQRQEIPATLYVASNTTDHSIRSRVSVDSSFFQKLPEKLTLSVEGGVERRSNTTGSVGFDVNVPAYDFRWFIVTDAQANESS